MIVSGQSILMYLLKELPSNLIYYENLNTGKKGLSWKKKYIVIIRPILEYASEVWDNCGQTNCNRLEKIQIEAARIVTGLSIYASNDSIYKETGWETLSTRREAATFFFAKLSIRKHPIIYLN